MALVLIKEDGTGKADANSYAAVADGDAYHEGHLYATAWTGASADTKAAALVMATRVIDGMFQFHGERSVGGQALQWPRSGCPDPDFDEDLPDDGVPEDLVKATCELARELIKEDRTDDPDGVGLQSMALTGVLTAMFDTVKRNPILTPWLEGLLGRYGENLTRRGGVVRLVRV